MAGLCARPTINAALPGSIRATVDCSWTAGPRAYEHQAAIAPSSTARRQARSSPRLQLAPTRHGASAFFDDLPLTRGFHYASRGQGCRCHGRRERHRLGDRADVRARRRRCDRRPQAVGADTAAGEIAAAGGTAMGIATDVTDEAEVDAGFAKLAATYGGADVLRSATPASRSSNASISSSSPSGSGS
jgi:hypothetical protein